MRSFCDWSRREFVITAALAAASQARRPKRSKPPADASIYGSARYGTATYSRRR